jgi:hypothetical protein
MSMELARRKARSSFPRLGTHLALRLVLRRPVPAVTRRPVTDSGPVYSCILYE